MEWKIGRRIELLLEAGMNNFAFFVQRKDSNETILKSPDPSRLVKVSDRGKQITGNEYDSHWGIPYFLLLT